LHDPLELLRIFAQNFNANYPSFYAIRFCKNITEKFNVRGCATTLQTTDRQERQTDRQTTDGRLVP